MKLQFVSDLHLEFPANRAYLAEHPLEVTGDILLVAGDTAYLDLPDSKEDTYSRYEFWNWASEHYQRVVVCFGNHDFYGHYDLATIPNGYCKQIRSNVHAYYNGVVNMGEVDIIVSTLWAYIKPENSYLTERGVSDFYRRWSSWLAPSHTSGCDQEHAGRSNRPTWGGARLHRRPRH